MNKHLQQSYWEQDQEKCGRGTIYFGKKRWGEFKNHTNQVSLCRVLFILQALQWRQPLWIHSLTEPKHTYLGVIHMYLESKP